jgi:hypothetical protein
MLARGHYSSPLQTWDVFRLRPSPKPLTTSLITCSSFLGISTTSPDTVYACRSLKVNVRMLWPFTT